MIAFLFNFNRETSKAKVENGMSIHHNQVDYVPWVTSTSLPSKCFCRHYLREDLWPCCVTTEEQKSEFIYSHACEKALSV